MNSFSRQYEIIHNPQTVDLLVSIAHSAAAEGVIDEPLPVGMALRVPLPDMSKILGPPTLFSLLTPQPVIQSGTAVAGPDGLCDFDDLSLIQVRALSRTLCLLCQLMGFRWEPALFNSLIYCHQSVDPLSFLDDSQAPYLG
jgi:hypothetical protein